MGLQQQEQLSARRTRPAPRPALGLRVFRPPFPASVGRCQASWRLLALATVAAAALLGSTAHAQIRVYDEKAGGSVATPAVGGLNLLGTQSTPEKPKSDKLSTSANASPTATPPTLPSVSFGVRTAPLVATSSSVPVRPQPPVSTPSAPVPPPVAPQPAEKVETKPEVFVFTKVSEFSPIVAARLKEISTMPGLDVVFYIDDLKPQEYMALGEKGFPDIPESISLVADGEGAIAEAYGVKKPNTIIIRYPTGAIRSYDLIKEIELFKSHIRRADGADAT